MTAPWIPDGSITTVEVGGKYPLTIYKQITAAMTNDKEKGHSLNMIEAALRNARTMPIEAKLEGLGTLSSQSTLVDHTMRDFLQFFEENIFDLASANHTLLGFLDNIGAWMANATTAANPLILKPVQNSVITNCRPPNVSFA